MMPQFANTTAWQQAELLMQPVFIRVIDNIRKQLEQSSWKGSYQDIQTWPEGTTAATQEEVLQLQQQLETAEPDQAAEIEHRLAQLPHPFPSYVLHLQRDGQDVTVDLWQLCYQICFKHYEPAADAAGTQVVEVDTSLIGDDDDVDWHRLDEKAKHVISEIFTHLPNDS